jgi:hypothetical protein
LVNVEAAPAVAVVPASGQIASLVEGLRDHGHRRVVGLDTPDKLAETVLAFDLDVVEVTGETEALDLCALRCGCAVRDQAEPHAALSEVLQHVERMRKQVHFLFPQARVAIGDLVGKVGVGQPPSLQHLSHDTPPGLLQLVPPLLVTRLVAPEGLRRIRDLHGKRGGICSQPRTVHVGDPHPRGAGIAVCRDQRVIEIDQEGFRK